MGGWRQGPAEGRTPVLVGVDGRPAGVLAVARVLAEVLPEHKANEVRRLQSEGRRVGMVGDGINDASALARADVGLAIGTGTDVSIEAADITLISGSLAGVVTAIRLSPATMRNIRQNLFFALVYNGIGIPVAAGVLYPFFGIRLNPVIAAAAMALSSLSVVDNANRLHRYRPAELAAESADTAPASVEPRVEIGAEPAVTSHAATSTGAGPADAQSPGQAQLDPVCGMTVAPETAAAYRETASGRYYFCSTGCAAAFDIEPDRYLAAKVDRG